VATPIGNRDDLSSRAVQALRSVDRVYAEDTRHSIQLLRHHGIEARLLALHEHNEQSQIDFVLTHLHEVGSAALICDAGTPLISDPGYRIVRACHEAGIKVSPVPGACALVSALSVCGLATDRFTFVGFPPAKRAARKTWLRSLVDVPHTQLLYESPHRIVDSLTDVAEIFGENREICVARELTKRYETVIRGASGMVLQTIRADSNQQRGEFVVVIAGKTDAEAASETVERDGLAMHQATGDTIRPGVGQAVAADIRFGFCRGGLSGEESPGSTGQDAR